MFSVISLGCSKNLVDTEKLIGMINDAGYDAYLDPEQIETSVVVVNTCGFIGDAKQESIDILLQLAKLKSDENSPLQTIVVMGCLSERYREELKTEIPEIDFIYGKYDWVKLIDDFRLGKIEPDPSYHRTTRTQTTPSHYAYLKIAEGCNRACSYCAIPIITGKYKSRTIEDIVEEAQYLVSTGVKELQIIAQDLTYYGIDLYKENKLAELVERLADIPGVKWLRLHYAYPRQFPYDLLRVMREKENVCAYLDLALQHSSEHMLKVMRRGITKEEMETLITQIRNEVPNIHLRTTLMVGHADETEEDFKDLMDFVRRMRFERMGAFMYSEEEGTYSAIHYKDNVSEEEKQRRLEELMTLQEDIALEINREKIGKTLKVIIDREEDDYYIGRTEYDSPEVDGEVLIKMKGQKMVIGEFYDVTITDADAFDLYVN